MMAPSVLHDEPASRGFAVKAILAMRGLVARLCRSHPGSGNHIDHTGQQVSDQLLRRADLVCVRRGLITEQFPARRRELASTRHQQRKVQGMI